jgi:sigma-B regulation protein RsbU (phosphoserine phosphatase)
MEKETESRLKRELKLKKFQFNSIFEFSESIYSSFKVESIMRIFFSTLMGQLGISRVFIYESSNRFLKKRGFKFFGTERKLLSSQLKKLGNNWFHYDIKDLPSKSQQLKDFLISKGIQYLVNISESEKRVNVLGLGSKFNKKELTTENIEYAFFVSKFSIKAVENALLINRLIESKRVEHEMKIAREIQLSLLPQSLPELKNFEISIIYQPINEVGGDYYDILKRRKGLLPILIADVEGKGLSAALLAASSQAILHSLNELYLFEPSKFFAKANSMIYDFTKGNRFITIFWVLLNDEDRSLTYVNAGHVPPIIISKNRTRYLTKGGFLTGFVENATYENETVKLAKGDIIISFTDGVTEVENPQGEDFGEDAVIQLVKKVSHLPADKIGKQLLKKVTEFSQKKKFRDDFTLIILKVK